MYWLRVNLLNHITNDCGYFVKGQKALVGVSGKDEKQKLPN